jgi:tRNA(fMet)-specific endonuclease VapC
VNYLPDTNVWIRYVTQRSSAVVTKFRSLSPQDIALCSPVLLELCYGAHRSARPTQNLAVVEALRQQFLSVPFDDDAAQEAGRVRALLASQGKPIGPYDLQISAIALAFNLTVVTHNMSEFSRVAGLKLEDWEASP